jgi:N-acetylmuramic acid 6-phosphate etherase
MHELDRLTTEQVNPETADLDLLSLTDALELLNAQDRQVPEAVRAEIPRIAQAVERIEAALRAGGRLIYVGAGTSGRLGVLDASEVPPTFGLPLGRVIGVIAGGSRALRESVEGAEDNAETGAAIIVALDAGPRDVVCGIAASGRTPYVLGALREARRLGTGTIGLTTNRPCEMEQVVDILIAPLVGPEPLSGSTRMKSGTAQKLVLNMLTTMTMVRLGKTYGNLMVDLRPTNEKLIHRAKGLIARIAGVSPEESARLFEASGGDTRVAILMGLSGLDACSAAARLTAAGGILRRAWPGPVADGLAWAAPKSE